MELIRFAQPRTALLLIFSFLSSAMISFNAFAHGELPDFNKLVQEQSASVVNISTTQKPQAHPAQGLQGMPNMENLPELLRRFWGQQMPMPDREQRSLGSGFIFSSDGYVLTNYHVVKDADEIIVRLSDRREIVAEMIGGDARSDVALLKLPGNGYPAVRSGVSETLGVGEWVVAIGSPFGFDHSVTAGIVSAKGRSLPNENYVPFIQTDVAINPGNSGGPLFNLDGEVVGINSQIYTRGGGSIGLSFAIPIDVAMEVVAQLKTSGMVKRGWLGVQIQEVNRDLAESFGLDKPMGALVAQVFEDTPAEDAGVQEGDIILEFDGHPINRSSDLPHVVGRTLPGERAAMKIVRNQKRKTIQVEVGLLPDESGEKPDRKGPAQEQSFPLGLMTEEVPEELKKAWDISSGVLVRRVMPGPAAVAGVRRGDVLTMIAGESIRNIKDFEEIVEDLPKGKAIPMRVVRQGRPFFSSLRIEK